VEQSYACGCVLAFARGNNRWPAFSTAESTQAASDHVILPPCEPYRVPAELNAASAEWAALKKKVQTQAKDITLNEVLHHLPPCAVAVLASTDDGTSGVANDFVLCVYFCSTGPTPCLLLRRMRGSVWVKSWVAGLGLWTMTMSKLAGMDAHEHPSCNPPFRT
jgi:hypothetical protein